MMSPDQIKALWDLNETLSRSLLLIRQDQQYITRAIASAVTVYDHPNTQQHHFENMLLLANVDYNVLPYLTEPETEGEPAYPTGRVDITITTGPLQIITAGTMDDKYVDVEWDDQYVNVEFQFDKGSFVAMKTLMGPAK